MNDTSELIKELESELAKYKLALENIRNAVEPFKFALERLSDRDELDGMSKDSTELTYWGLWGESKLHTFQRKYDMHYDGYQLVQGHLNINDIIYLVYTVYGEDESNVT